MKATQHIGSIWVVLMITLSCMPAHAETLGVYSFSEAKAGETSGFSVENPVPDLDFSRLQAKWSSIGVVTAFAADAPHTEEPFASYAFDGKGYEVMLEELNQGDNPPPTIDFMEFSIEPKSGKTLVLESVSIDFGSDFTTTFQPSLFYNLWYSVNGKDYFRIGQPTELKTNSHVFKIMNDVTKPFHQYPQAQYDGKGKITFRLAFRDGKGSASSQKRLFIDDIKVTGSIAQ